MHRLGRSDLVAGDFAAPPDRIATDPCASGRQSATCPRPDAVSTPPAGLHILQPTADLHVRRNPELPQALDRLLLKAAAPAGLAQVTWIVDGAPFATVRPGTNVTWALSPGRHRFQLKLPFRPDMSVLVTIVVE